MERSCCSIGDSCDDDDDGVSTEEENAHVENGGVRTRCMDELSHSLLSPYSEQKSPFFCSIPISYQSLSILMCAQLLAWLVDATLNRFFLSMSIWFLCIIDLVFPTTMNMRV